MSAARSPIRARKKQPFGPKGPTFWMWSCDESLRSAQFQNRHDPKLTAIVHRSTKGPGWQTTFFEDGIPTGDVQSPTCQVSVGALGPRLWRLRRVR